jgi:hypothetical protein
MNPLHLLLLSALAIAGCGTSTIPLDKQEPPTVTVQTPEESPDPTVPANTKAELHVDWSEPDLISGARAMSMTVLLTNAGGTVDPGVRVVFQRSLNPETGYDVGPELMTIDVAGESIRRVGFLIQSPGPFWLKVNVSRADLTVIHQELEFTQFFPPSNG